MKLELIISLAYVIIAYILQNAYSNLIYKLKLGQREGERERERGREVEKK